MEKVLEEDILLDFDENGNQIYLYEGELFTGMAVEYWPNGKLRSEGFYIDGTPKVEFKEWYENGQLKYSQQPSDDGVFITSEEWYEDGSKKSEILSEHGFQVSIKEWDEKNNLIKDFRLLESSPYYPSLLLARNNYNEEKDKKSP